MAEATCEVAVVCYHDAATKHVMHLLSTFSQGYGLHYNTEVKVFNYTLLGGRPVSMQIFRFTVNIIYLFLHCCLALQILVLQLGLSLLHED